MALSGRIRHGIVLFNKLGHPYSDCLSTQRSTLTRFHTAPANYLASRNYATSTGHKEPKIKVTGYVVVVAENGRPQNLESIAKKFVELTMAYKGEMKAAVTTVIPLTPEEEQALKETLEAIVGARKKVRLEQKIDPSILGGLVVEFNQKVLDMSIKTRALQMERFLQEPIDFVDI